jgi:hypothetical protein
MNPQSRPVWLAISVIVALLVGVAAGFLSRQDGSSHARSILTAGTWSGGCFLGALAVITLLITQPE